MVARTYDAPEFRVRDNREVNAPRVQGADTRVMMPNKIGDEAWKDNFLGSLLGQGQKVLQKASELHLQNQYLEGAAAAGVVESEEELQGDPLTRDWKVAGYRDTMGKLALADMESKFLEDLPMLREKDTPDLQKYLSDRRAKVMPALAGMSREARSNVAGQMHLQDRAATRKWTTEHQKYILDMKAQAIDTQWATSLKSLESVGMAVATGQATDKDYTEQIRVATGALVGSVWGDKTLPSDAKAQLTFTALSNALQRDNVAVYEYLQANALPDGKGTLIDRLPGEQQGRLSSAYREAMNRTAERRNFASNMELAGIESQIDNDTFEGTPQDLFGFLQAKTMRREVSAERAGGLYNKLLDKRYKGEQGTFLANSFMSGDLQGLYSKGKDEADGAKALEAQMARAGMAPEQRLVTWLTAGRNGMQTGYKKAGESLGVAVRSMVDSKTNEVLPQHLATFNTIATALRQAEADGLTNTRVNLLSGMGEDDRMFVEQVLRRTESGASATEAIQQAKDIAAKDAAMTPALKAARASTNSTAVSKAIDGMESRGLLGSLWTGAKALVGSADAAADMALRPRNSIGDRDGWFSNSETVQFYEGRMREALREEAGNVMLLYPDRAPESVVSVAKANLAARTIRTEQGPVFLPRGTDMQQAFGVGPGNQTQVGPAIDDMLKGTVADSRWQVSFTNGQLFAQEYDKGGQRVGQGVFIPGQEVGRRVLERSGTEFKKANEQFGAGREVEADGVKLQFNGQGTAGVPAEWMFDFRANLVQSEGIRKGVYKDTRGLNTVGVGVMEKNKHFPKPGPDGTVSAEDIAKSFAGASNDAARAGADAAMQLNRYTGAGFQLLSELAYQSGTAFITQRNVTGDKYREFGIALRGNDADKAKTAFKSTAAWYYSGESRRQHYLSLIDKAMKGN